jgi:predicted transcriptional regulator
LGTKESVIAMTTAEARTKLHDLVESLPSDNLSNALRLLEELNSTSDPILIALRDVPFDDEPETEEERAAVAEARREIEEGRLIPDEEVMRKYDL